MGRFVIFREYIIKKSLIVFLNDAAFRGMTPLLLTQNAIFGIFEITNNNNISISNLRNTIKNKLN